MHKIKTLNPERSKRTQRPLNIEDNKECKIDFPILTFDSRKYYRNSFNNNYPYNNKLESGKKDSFDFNIVELKEQFFGNRFYQLNEVYALLPITKEIIKYGYQLGLIKLYKVTKTNFDINSCKKNNPLKTIYSELELGITAYQNGKKYIYEIKDSKEKIKHTFNQIGKYSNTIKHYILGSDLKSFYKTCLLHPVLAKKIIDRTIRQRANDLPMYHINNYKNSYDKCIELGFDVLDIADMYSRGTLENILNKTVFNPKQISEALCEYNGLDNFTLYHENIAKNINLNTKPVSDENLWKAIFSDNDMLEYMKLIDSYYLKGLYLLLEKFISKQDILDDKKYKNIEELIEHVEKYKYCNMSQMDKRIFSKDKIFHKDLTDPITRSIVNAYEIKKKVGRIGGKSIKNNKEVREKAALRMKTDTRLINANLKGRGKLISKDDIKELDILESDEQS